MRTKTTSWIPAVLLIVLIAALCAGNMFVGARTASALTASNMLSKAAALMEAGRMEEAVSVYDGVIQEAKFTRDIHEALYRKSLCLQAMKRYEEAIACWNILLTRYTRTKWDDAALLEMGNTYTLNMDRPDDALRCYERLVKNYTG